MIYMSYTNVEKLHQKRYPNHCLPSKIWDGKIAIIACPVKYGMDQKKKVE